MDEDRFARQMETLSTRVTELSSRRDRGPGPPEGIVDDVLAELHTSLEELRVAEEEMRRQNEDLVDATRGLEIERQRYQDLFDLAPDGYLVTDSDGIIREANRAAAALLHIRREFLPGKSLLSLISEGSRTEFIAQMHTLGNPNEAPRNWEARLRPRVRKPFDALLTVSAIRTLSGGSNGFRWILRDISERKRLEQTLRAHAAILTDTIRTLSTPSEPDAFLGHTLIAVTRHLHLHSCALTLRDKEGEEDSLDLRAGYMVFAERGGVVRQVEADAKRTVYDDSPVWQELQRSRLPLVVTEEAEIARAPSIRSLLSDGVQTLLFAPLIMDDTIIGVLILRTTEAHGYSPEECELAHALAQQITLAIRLARLAEQGRQTAILEERNRIAQEIHDTLAQGFTGIAIQLEAALDAMSESREAALDAMSESREAARRHISRARDLARDSLAEARRSVWALRPHALEGGLADALAHMVAEANASKTVHARMEVEGTPRPLHPGVEHDLLRIGQEAITNVVRHAHAKELRLTLRYEAEAAVLEVEDDGVGFDPESTTDDGFGLISMRERAERRQGGFFVAGRPGEGTRLTVRIPAGEAARRGAGDD